MADVLDPRLSTPTSQARVNAPIVTSSAPNSRQILAGSLLDIANVAIRAKQASDKKDARAQAASDEAAVGEAIIARNEQLNQRDELLGIQQDLITASDDIEKMKADGIISDDEAVKIQEFQSKQARLKSAEAQNLLDPTKFNIQSRKLLNQEIAKNPRIGKELFAIFNKTTGGTTSPTTGATQAKQIQLNQMMNEKYQGNWSLEDLKKEAAMQSQVLNAKRNKELGSISIDNIAASTSINVSQSIESVLTPAGKRFEAQGALTNEDEQKILEGLHQRESQIIAGIRKDIFSAQKEGRIVDDAEARALIADVERQFDEARKYITDKGLLPQLKKRNELSDQLWKAQMGNKVSRFQSVSSVMGQGGMTALSALITADSGKDRDTILALSDGTPQGFDLSNFKADMVDAMARISQDQPVPGFEKLDAFLGLKAMKSGPVGEPVKQNTISNITNLVKNPQDAADALASFNDAKVARQMVEGDETTQAQFVNSVNSNEALIFNEIEDGGFSVRFVQEGQDTRVDRRGRDRTVVTVPARLEVFKTAKANPTGRGIGGKDRDVVNSSLTRKINTALDLHKNPAYSSLLQPSLPWVQQVIEQFSPVEQQEEVEQPTE